MGHVHEGLMLNDVLTEAAKLTHDERHAFCSASPRRAGMILTRCRSATIRPRRN